MIKAIETTYGGILFRSRLEARWAVFMDAMNVRYVYEPEAYDLGDCCYLPDFWLPDLNTFLEIKPVVPTEAESRKAVRLAEDSNSRVIILFGSPGYVTDAALPMWWADQEHAFSVSPYNSEVFYGGGDCGYCWCQCSVCGMAGLEYEGRGSRLTCGCNGFDHFVNTPDLRRAYELAMSARFDPFSIRERGLAAYELQKAGL